jgi:hypothetical protein
MKRRKKTPPNLGEVKKGADEGLFIARFGRPNRAMTWGEFWKRLEAIDKNAHTKEAPATSTRIAMQATRVGEKKTAVRKNRTLRTNSSAEW